MTYNKCKYTLEDGLILQKDGVGVTALRREAIQLVEQMPEEQMAHIIRYIRKLRDKEGIPSDDEQITTPQMQAFLKMEKMIVPVPLDLDHDKELAEARDERYN